jgi:ribosomal protein S18 acetylase RimI-like enzyme
MSSGDRDRGPHGATDPEAPIRIVPMTRDMLDVIADLHQRSFESRLGRRYSRALVGWYLTREEDAIAIAAVDAADEPVGYAVGAPEGHEAALQRAILPTVVTQLALRPWRWFDPYVVRTIRARLRPSTESSGAPHPSPASGGDPAKGESPATGRPPLCLVAIGVSPTVRGHGVGERLMEAFEARARALGAASLTLWVRKDNAAARRLYVKCGWALRATGGTGDNTGIYDKTL